MESYALMTNDVKRGLSGRELERLGGCREDLRLVNSLSQCEHVEPREIRQASVHLRRLLFDDELKFAASVAEMKIRLIVPPEIPSTEVLTAEGVTFFQRSPTRLRGIKIGDISNGSAGRADYEGDVFLLNGPVNLNAFLNQRVVVFFGESIRRRDLLQYAANIMGGAHYGTRLNKNLDAVNRLRNAILFSFDNGCLVIKIQGSEILNQSDKIVYVDQHYNPVHLELLATMRLLSESEIVKQLLDWIDRVIPP